jgi:hypothetical protein
MNSHKGFGDTVAAVAEKLKLDILAEKAAKAVGKEDCGCKKRQLKLNELLPYSKK